MAFVQDASNGSSSATAIAVTISPTAGNAVALASRVSSGAAITWTTNVGSFTPTFICEGAESNVALTGTNAPIKCYIYENVPAGITSITGTVGVASRFGICAQEHGNILTSASLDVIAEAIGSSGTADSGATATTAQATELVMAFLNTAGTIASGAAGTGFSNYEERPAERVALCSKYVTAVGTYNGLFTFTTQAWYCAASTHKEVVVAAAADVRARTITRPFPYTPGSPNMSGGRFNA